MKKSIAITVFCLIMMLLSGCSQVVKNLPQETSTTQSAATVNSGTNDDNEKSTTAVESGQIKKVTLNLYFAYKDNSGVPKEKREVQVKDGAIMRAAVEALLEGPQNKEFRKPIPDGTKLLGIKKDGNVAVVDFSKEFRMGVNDIAEIVEMASVVNTLTDIPGIQKVRVLIEGKDAIAPSGMPYGEKSKYEFDENGYPIPGEAKTITLYFGNADAEKVVAEKRNVEVSKGEGLEGIIFGELIQGPKKQGLEPVIPKDTKLLSIKTQNGICTVDLSHEFIDNSPGGTAAESITIYSVVNSLTELPEVKKVQFLMDGKKREVYTHVAFSEPFSRNEAMIQK